jgi:hypothetical protein
VRATGILVHHSTYELYRLRTLVMALLSMAMHHHTCGLFASGPAADPNDVEGRKQ